MIVTVNGSTMERELGEAGIREESWGSAENEGSNNGFDEFLREIVELERQGVHSTRCS